MTVDNLEKELKQNNLQSIYLFYGEELYLLENAVKKIKKIFGELLLGINYIQINENNIESLISDIETPAFGFSKKLIIVKNTGLLKKSRGRTLRQPANNNNNDELQKKIAKYLKENIDTIKDTTVLIFIENDITKCELVKVIEENGIECNFERLKPIDIVKRLKAICNAYGVNVEQKDLNFLIETSGTDMQCLINEIRKLIEYKGKGEEILKEDIDKLTIKQLESVIFDLTDNLGKKETTKALEVLKNLINQKEPLQKILITLYNHFKKIYITKLSEKYGKQITLSLQLKPNQVFLVNKYKMQSKYFKEQDLKGILQDLRDLDYNYKNGLIDLQIGLESILCRYC